jgi:putative acetyltransferase
VEGPGGKVLGTIGLYPLDEEMVELRKMYFLPSLRGRGLGRRLLERMIAIAKQKGYRRIYLETASRLKEAVHLYESVGFRPFEEKHTPRCDQAYVLELGE